MKGKKVHDVLNRLHLAMPNKRDEKVNTATYSARSRSPAASHFSGSLMLFCTLSHLLFPGEASVHPRRSLDAQEGDGDGHSQTQAGMSSVHFMDLIKLRCDLYNKTFYCSPCRREIWRWSSAMTTFWTYRVRSTSISIIRLPL